MQHMLGISALALSVALAGCASQDKTASTRAAKAAPEVAPAAAAARVEPKTESQPIRASFSRPNGKVALEFADDGRWVSIASIASAPVGGAGQASVEQAVAVATLKARRNLAEFMGGDIQSARSLRVLSRGVQRSQAATATREASEVSSDEDFDDRSESALDSSHEKVAQTLRETVTQNAAAILKGVMTSREDHDRAAGTVTVEVRATQRSIEAARAIRMEMER